jgi:broad specificity phosphatase PhoE
VPAILLLRHGQASFGTDDYDVLSDLGRVQCDVAARELARRGLRSPVVLSGGLRRQRETAQIVAAVLGTSASSVDPRFDEFDAHAAVDAHLGRPGATHGLSSQEFQGHLDVVMAEWMASGDERWRSFADEAHEAVLGLAASLPKGSDAVVATSAGVTAVLVGRLLGADPNGVIALNRTSVNASITTIVAGSRGLSLVAFNDHAHFLADRSLLTNR